MPDLTHDDPVAGRVIVTFDGRILEKFSERSASAERMIVGLLHVDVGDPNRKGRREIMFSCRPNRRGGGFTLWAEEDQWPAVEPFVREVASATTMAAT
jgi:hypothetical protein